MYSKNSFKMLAIILSLIGFSSVEAFSAAITWDGGASTNNWFDAANWLDDNVPGFDDDVTITGGVTVLVNGAADVNSLTVNDGVVRPDASSARSIVIRRDLTVGSDGSILYTDAGGTGRLSWTFEAEDGTNTIDNQTDDEALLQFYDVTINGTIDTDANVGNGNMQIYGDLTINGGFQPSNTPTHSTVHFVGIGTEPGKTIANNGTLELNSVELESNAAISTVTDIDIIGDLTIGTGSSFAVNSPSIFTTDDDATPVTYTNNGTLTFAAGTSWNINKDLTITEDIDAFAGDITLEAAAVLTIESGHEIQGTGSFTAGDGAGLVLSDADGVAGALNLSGGYTWPTGANAVNVTIESGSTGFSGVGLTEVLGLTIGASDNTTSNININDSFSLSGDLTIPANTDATTVTATSGTITMTGAGAQAINPNQETLDLFGLIINDGTGVRTVTIADNNSLTIANTLSILGDDVLTFGGTNTNNQIVFDDDAELTTGSATGLTLTNDASLDITGTLTLLSDINVGAISGGGVNVGATGTLDFQDNTLTIGAGTGVFDTSPGSILKTSHEDGIAGNLTTTANPTIDVGTNYEFNTDADDFGFYQVGNAATNIAQVNDIVINGGTIATTGSGGVANNVDVQVDGDLTVTTGSLILPSDTEGILTFGANNSAITNSTGDEDNLVFNILDIAGANTVTVDGDISIARASAAGLTNSAGAGTLDCTTNDATVHFVGATLNISSANGATYNFHNVEIENITTINANVTAGLMNIAGDLTLTAPGTLVGATASAVDFNGTVEQTIETNGQTLTFDIITISNTTGVTTNDDITMGVGNGATTLSGQFVANDPSVITFTGTGNLVCSGNSSTFFEMSFGGAPATHSGNYSVVSAVSGAGTFDPAGTVTFLGDPNELDATGNGATDEITNDGLQEATISVTTLGAGNNGTISIDDNCELQVSVAIADATNFDVDGRLELTAAAAACAGATTIDLTIGDGGTLHLSDLDGANANDLDDAVETNGTLTSDETSTIILNGTNTTLFNGTGGAPLTVGDLTFNSGAAMTLEALDVITLHGTLTLSGTDNVAGGGDADSEIIMEGTASSITGSQILSVGSITVDADLDGTAATIDADQIILEENATAVVEVNDGGSLTCSDGEIQINAAADAGVANIINGNTDGSGLVFNDLTINAASTETDFDSGITVNGTLDVNATGKLHAISATGVLTLNGTSEQFTYDLAAAGDIELFDLIIDGSITVAQDGAEEDELIEIFGDLTVTGNGSLAMTDGGISFGDGGAPNDVTITNNGTLQFHDLVINKNANTDVVTVTDNYTINGDFTNTQGEFRNNSNDVTFEGSSTFLSEGGNASTTFNNINFDGTTVLGNGALDASISGNIIVGSGSSAQSSTFADGITFIGSSDKEISNAGTLQFGSLTVADEASNNLSTGDSFSLSGTMTVGGATGGSFEATGGTVSFNSGTFQTVTNGRTNTSTALQFNNVILTGASTTVTAANEDFYINGNITLENDATLDFQANDLRLFLAGDNQQVVTLTGTGTAGTSARMLLHDVTLNNEEGIQLAGVTNDITDDQFDIEGTFRLSDGDIDLNGNNVLTIDVASGGDLDEDYINNHLVVNEGPSTSTGNVYATNAAPGALSGDDFGGLGAIFTSDDPGTLTVRRYHIPRDIGGNSQASKYFSIVAANTGIDAKVVFKYADDEISGLTETDLILMYADDPDGPWYKESEDLDTSLQRITAGGTAETLVEDLTGATEWWTIGTPSELSATQLTNGLASDTLAAGTSDNAIFGVQFTAEGEDITLNNAQFDFGRNLDATTAEFTNYILYYSTDDDYSTTSDNVELINGTAGSPAAITGGGTGDNNVSFDLASLNSDYVTVEEGTPINYFLVVSTDVGLNLNTTTITPQMTNTELTVSDGIIVPYTLTGNHYDFRSSIEVSPNENGLDESPLVAGETGKAIFGFKAEITDIAGLPGFTGFTIDFEGDPSAVFENVQALESTGDSDFNTTADNDVLDNLNVTITDSNIVFTFDEQNLGLTPQYYFVTADVKNTVDPSTEPVTPTMVYSNIASTNAGVRGTDIDGEESESHTGYTYDFVKATVTLSTSNNPEAGNLGTNLANQPIYGFNLTPDGGQSVTLDEVIIQVDFSDASEAENVDQWKLYIDGNENGYGDADDDSPFNGSYENGVLTFEDIDETFTSETQFILTARIKSGVTAGTTISAQILGEDYLTINSPNTINAGGPFPATAVQHTVRASGPATAFEIAGTYERTVITGNTLSFIVRAVDSDGYPTRVNTTTAVTIGSGAGTGTVAGAGASGNITAGTGFVVLTPTISNGAVSTDLQVEATGGLTDSELSDAITILLAAPTANDGEVLLNDITATTIGITDINAAFTPGNGRIVVMKQGGRPDAPTNGVEYTAALDIATAGDVGVGQTGPGSYVVYNTGDGVNTDVTGLSIDVTGLVPNKRYYFMVYEYNGTDTNLTYSTETAFTDDDSQNPKFVTTLDGALSNADSTAAVNLPTNIDVTSAIASEGAENWFIFRVSGDKVNARVDISNLPANYNIDIYDGTGGVDDLELLRQSQVSGTSREVLILNELSASETYYIKVYGDDDDQFSSTNYTIRVSTSAREFYSLTEE